MTDLFGGSTKKDTSWQPLAARMRPRTLDEFVGQEQIVGQGSLLRAAIENDQMTSMIFWGPPGCGKSALAGIIAEHTKSSFEPFSAVTSGVPDLRKVMLRAKERLKANGQKTILFVDEIHRFNKAQQDALLPHVEDGTILLIGATTENPYFEVNTPLISRSRIFRFEPLSDEAVRMLVLNAIADKERGLGKENLQVDDDAIDHMVAVAQGDARSAISALELAVKASPIDPKIKKKLVTIKIAEQAVQKRVLNYDKNGDNHYDTISAFIKSMRGSDPDAAIYWLARMLKAGEDPKFVARRLVIQAAEDIGNADPMALVVATAAADAVQFVGMPEAQIPLAQATIYLACAPKSNASYVAINRANKDVTERKPPPVPKHLRGTGYPGAKDLGHGEGYKYPHEFPGHYVEQEYLPKEAKSQPYYEPTDNGHEAKFKQRLERLRGIIPEEEESKESNEK
ncbi:MAG: replication-associated recombination protein A [Armatimonadetes bacterium]|nr:replication-associated recombination protein A [Armatimonadota bacterium]